MGKPGTIRFRQGSPRFVRSLQLGIDGLLPGIAIAFGLQILSLLPVAASAADTTGNTAAGSIGTAAANSAASTVADTLTVQSPDGTVHVNFIMLEGSPFYSVAYHGKNIIAPSALGFRLLNAAPLLSELEIEETERLSFDETWYPVCGERSEIQNNYTELDVALREIEDPHRKIKIVFRIFDDGIGFRYELPAQENLRSFAIVSEETRFNFTGNHTAW